MFIKDLAVYVDNDGEAPKRIELAMALAERHNAEVTAVYIRRPIYSPKYIGTYIPADVVEQLERVADAEEREARDTFSSILSRSNVESHWHSSTDSPARALTMVGRNMDLLVLRPDNEDEGVHRHYRPGEVVLSVGRPVLLAAGPNASREPVSHAVIAWSGTRESTRAVHDALPMLSLCKRVSAVTFGEPAYGDMPLPDVTQHLARHGITADWQRLPNAYADTGLALAAFVEESGADLIVAGAYGHSRLLEMVLGV